MVKTAFTLIICDVGTEEKTDGVENRFQMLEGSNPINAKLNEMVSEIDDGIIVLGSEKDYPTRR